jgi:two-component system nitrogen regulation sensor histidine kinase NtrY
MPDGRAPDRSGSPEPLGVSDDTHSGLAPAERHRRRRELALGLLVVALLAWLVPQPPVRGWLEGVGEGGLFLFFNAVTVILILVFGFLVTRNFWKLVLERRRGGTRTRLDLKFVSAFVLVAFVTTTGLLLVSSLFVTSSIDRWFSVQVDRALDESQAIAENTWAGAARDALATGTRLAAAIQDEGLLEPGRIADLTELVERYLDESVGLIEVLGEDGEPRISAVNSQVQAAEFPDRGSALVRAALAGEASWEVADGSAGDAVRAAVPIAGGGGAVVVNAFVPYPLARSLESVRAVVAEYRALEPSAGQIRAAYLLALLLAAMMILMLAVWLSLRLARGVTRPLRALAEGTAEVARGNLDVTVRVRSDDEVGLLVDSFNRMTADLREARASIEHKSGLLEQRRRSMEVLLRTLAAGVVSLDADGRIGTLNPSAQRYLDVDPAVDWNGAKLAEVARRGELVEAIQELTGGLRPGRRESGRRQAQVRLGDEVATLLVTAALLPDDSEGPFGSVVVLDDATQLVAVQRMAAWREVARRIAHEIKNPLTPIQLSAQRIRRRFRPRLSDDARDLEVFDGCVDAIEGEVESLKLLVDEFSNFARLPTGNPRPDDLNRIVSDAVASYAGTDGVAFDTDLAEGLPPVDVDRAQVRRVLTNLIDNALHAVDRARQQGAVAGRVALRTCFDSALQSVRFEVCDDGIGIPSGDRHRIFEPYYSTRRNGTGLGLAIVSRIVADHRGYIRVQDNRPRGTRFVVELPVRGDR